jgi:hypothetical protein
MRKTKFMMNKTKSKSSQRMHLALAFVSQVGLGPSP